MKVCFFPVYRIFGKVDGSMMVTGQRFYDCKDVERGRWVGIGERELIYSLDCIDFPVEHVFLNCSVLFIPHGNRIPKSGEPIAYMVRKVYDTKKRVYST